MTPREFLVQVEALCREMAELQSQAARALSQADKAVSVIYHEVEFARFDAAQGYLLAWRLKEALQHRRAVKREQELLAAVRPLVDTIIQRQREANKRLANCEARQAQLSAT